MPLLIIVTRVDFLIAQIGTAAEENNGMNLVTLLCSNKTSINFNSIFDRIRDKIPEQVRPWNMN